MIDAFELLSMQYSEIVAEIECSRCSFGAIIPYSQATLFHLVSFILCAERAQNRVVDRFFFRGNIDGKIASVDCVCVSVFISTSR